MEVVVTTGAVRRAKLQSNCHHQQTNTQFLLQVGSPFCRPSNSVASLTEIHISSTRTRFLTHWTGLLFVLWTDCYAWDRRRPCEASFYYVSGFSTLQLALDTAIHAVRRFTLQMWLDVWQPRAGSVVVRIDPLRLLAGCRRRRLNHALYIFVLGRVARTLS